MTFKLNDPLGKSLGMPAGLVTSMTEKNKTLVSFTNGTPAEVVELRDKAVAAGLIASARLNYVANLYAKEVVATKSTKPSASRTPTRRRRAPVRSSGRAEAARLRKATAQHHG